MLKNSSKSWRRFLSVVVFIGCFSCAPRHPATSTDTSGASAQPAAPDASGLDADALKAREHELREKIRRSQPNPAAVNAGRIEAYEEATARAMDDACAKRPLIIVSEVTLAADGRVQSVAITKGSGSDRCDEAGALVLRRAKWKNCPDTPAQECTFSYTLTKTH